MRRYPDTSIDYEVPISENYYTESFQGSGDMDPSSGFEYCYLQTLFRTFRYITYAPVAPSASIIRQRL